MIDVDLIYNEDGTIKTDAFRRPLLIDNQNDVYVQIASSDFREGPVDVIRSINKYMSSQPAYKEIHCLYNGTDQYVFGVKING